MRGSSMIHHQPNSMNRIWTGLLLIATASTALAAAPDLGNIVPRGAQRGTVADVVFSGTNLADAADIVFHDPGIKVAEMGEASDTEVKVKLEIAPDCRLGEHAMRVRTRTGVSDLMLFSVGNLPEITETEPNNDIETAPEVTLNGTINGIVQSEDVDYYAVQLAEGQRMSVEVEGLRLGNLLFDPKLRLFGPHGHELIAEDDTQVLRQDAGFVYVAKEAGRYVVAISEASYGGSGNSYYRLHIGDFPRPLSVTPLGGAPGAATTLTWLGDPGLTPQEVTVPADPPGVEELAVVTDKGVSPTGLPFRISDLAGVLEAEPNNSIAEATEGTAPGAFDGVIGEPGDVDYFKFNGLKDQTYDLRVWARALGSPLDSVLGIHKPNGEALAGDDDAAAVDSLLRVTLPEDGVYTLYVHDHLRRGGPGFAYRVEATPVVPKLKLTVAENKPVYATLPAGNQTYLLVNVSRSDFDGPVKLAMPDLPEGVVANAVEVPAGVTTMPVILTATPEAPVGGGLVHLEGTLDNPDQAVAGGLHQEVVLVYGQNEVTFYAREVDRLALAVSEPAPFSVHIVPPKVPAVQQSYMMLTVEATRAEGFTAPIDLLFPYLPSGLGGGTARIEEGQNSAQIRLEIRGDAPVETKEIFVAARSAGFQLCTPVLPLEVQEPWVRFELTAVETEIGKPLDMTVKLIQRAPFEGTFDLNLFGLPKGVTAPAQPFTSATTEVVFPLTVAEDAPAGKFESVGASATIIANEEPLVHQGFGGKLTLFAPLPAELQAQAPPPAPAAPEGQPARKTRFPTT